MGPKTLDILTAAKELIKKLRKPRNGPDKDNIVVFDQGDVRIKVRPGDPDSALTEMFTQNIDIPGWAKGSVIYNNESRKWEFIHYDEI